MEIVVFRVQSDRGIDFKKRLPVGIIFLDEPKIHLANPLLR